MMDLPSRASRRTRPRMESDPDPVPSEPVGPAEDHFDDLEAVPELALEGAEEAGHDSGAADSDVGGPHPAQPLGEDGVGKDMATATYARGWQGGTESEDAKRAPRAESFAAPEEGSDAAIMLRVSQGDESCFTYLIEKYRRQMIHYMFRMTANQAVAEELAQEVFLRVYRSRESYRAEAKFTTWLYRIATNLGVNYARDHKHEKAAQNVYLDQPDAESGTTPDVADSRLTVEQSMMRSERLAGIRAKVLALPERQRQAVLMHKYQEMDYREIGAVLKLSESATKSLLFRAYQALREQLKDYV